MAIILVHLRRIILLMSIVYLSGACCKKLLLDSRHAYLLHMNGSGNILWAKHLHFQWWAYIYTIYGYILFINYINLRRYMNRPELFQSLYT